MALAATGAFTLITVVVVGAAPRLLPGDAMLHHWSVTHRPGAGLALARAVTATGTGVIPFVVVLLAGLCVHGTVRRRAATAAALALCLGSGQALRYAVMALVSRPRPPRADWATLASGWSFPSGHASTSAMTAGLVMAALYVRGPRLPPVAAVLIGMWGMAVGLSRIYLGVHWVSDVIGAWLFATAWLALTACAYLLASRATAR